MKLARRQFLHLAAGATAIPAISQFAWAQTYPSRPVRLIVGFAPSGGNDIVARLIAQWLSERLGQQFIVENRPGAGSNIGTEIVVNSPADGYTLLLVSAANAINASMFDKLNFNFIRDVAPVAGVLRVPLVMVVNPSVPARTVTEFISFAKANPGKFSYGSPGLGSSGHLAGEQFKQLNNLEIQHVHYRGAAPALQDLVAGHVQVMFDIVPLTKEQLAAGRVKALAITAARREPAVPNVPTFAELGMPGIEGGPWFGLFAPAGTPHAAIDWVNAEANKAFSSPDLKARLEGQGLTLPLGTPEAFGKHVEAETARWGEVIRKGNIKAE